MKALSQVTLGPTALPVGLSRLKELLRIEWDDEDALLQAYLEAAVREAELYLRRSLVAQTRQVRLSDFPCTIELGEGPLLGVSSLAYYDTANAAQTLTEGTHFEVDDTGPVARVQLKYGQSWPGTYTRFDAVTLTYTAGHLVPFTAAASSATLTSAGHNLSDGDIFQLSSTGTLPSNLSVRTNYYVVSASGSSFGLATSAGGAAITIGSSPGSGTQFLGVLPGAVAEAICQSAAHWHRHVEPELIGTISKSLPDVGMKLLSRHRLLEF